MRSFFSILFVVAPLVVACSYSVDYSGTLYQCGPNGECPTGSTCTRNYCVPDQPPDDGGTDGSDGNDAVDGDVPPAMCAGDLAAGYAHSCTLRTDGTVWCWGRNDFGQLGDNSAIDRPLPTQVMGLSNVIDIAAGAFHTCAIKSDTTTWCWGRNLRGPLGDGSQNNSRVPVQSMGVSAKAIVAADQHTCAILTDDTVSCWGWGNSGELGNGGSLEHDVAEPVVGLTTVKALASGGATTCAIQTDGTVWCWGVGDLGQIGNMMTPAAQRTPAQVVGIASAEGIVVGGGHACAWVTGGAVSCWGRGFELGYGSSVNSSVPVATHLPVPAVGLFAGFAHTCARDAANRLWCWGSNLYYELGTGTTAYAYNPLISFPGADAMAGGFSHVCVRKDSAISCIGDNDRGQIGDGTRPQEYVPIATPGPANVTTLALGGYHSCALAGGAASCWGENDNGEIGDGTEKNRPFATSVVGATGITTIASSTNHTCTIGPSGALACWGYNGNGELGDGTKSSRAVIATVIASGATHVSAGGSHTCAIVSGSVFCWGYNNTGQLGNGVIGGPDITSPPVTPVTLPMAATQVASGDRHTCALLADQTVMCWGYNFDGQLGNGTFGTPSTTPTAVMNLTGVAELRAGIFATCARRMADNSVWCWGYGINGRLGNGTFTSSNVPVQAIGVTATSIALGGGHACATRADGAVWCWGAGSNGQIGDGAAVERSTPVLVPGMTDVTAVSTGAAHTCVAKTDGSVHCWGYNLAGQLGNGYTQARTLHNTRLTCP